MTTEEITILQTDPVFGACIGEQKLRVHSRDACVGPHCCIHNPSDHSMKNWPLHWRADTRMMERLCLHGVGHPDPDDLEFRKWHLPPMLFDGGVHGCDGCCHG